MEGGKILRFSTEIAVYLGKRYEIGPCMDMVTRWRIDRLRVTSDGGHSILTSPISQSLRDKVIISTLIGNRT